MRRLFAATVLAAAVIGIPANVIATADASGSSRQTQAAVFILGAS